MAGMWIWMLSCFCVVGATVIREKRAAGTWSPYSPWSACTGNCETGSQRRTRTCSGGACTGEGTQTQTCDHCSSTFDPNVACTACDFSEYYHNLVPDPCNCRSYYSCEKVPVLGWKATKQPCSNCTVFDVTKQVCVYDGVSLGGCEEVINEQRDEISTSVCQIREQNGAYTQMFGVVAGDSSSYIWYIDGSLTGRQVPMPCAPGTHFVHVTCRCEHGGVVSSGGEIMCLDFDTFRPSDNHLIATQNIYVESDHLQYKPGHSGDAGFFDGVDAEVEVPFFQNIELRQGLSVSFWFKRESAGVSASQVMGLVSAENCATEFIFHVTSTAAGTLSAGAKTLSGDAINYFTNINAAVDTWNHVVLSYDTAKLELFVNKVSQGSVPLAGTLKMPLCPLHLGSTHTTTPTGYFKGLMDEVCFWRKGLTQSEVNLLYDA